MNIPIVLAIGAVIGGLAGASIFFEPREPYKWEILIAATLKGALVSLLTAFSLHPGSHWWAAAAVGALYGMVFGVVIYLAKGGLKSGDAPYVIPSGIVTGALSGLFVLICCFRSS